MSVESNPWAPYEPSRQDPWDRRKVAHLHRRAGFGATWDELTRDAAAGPAASIDRLLHPPAETVEFRQVAAALKQAGIGTGGRYANDPREIGAWWLYRLTFGPDPLGEKLTLAWHNHFATALHGVYRIKPMVAQNELFRRQARGKFSDLLREIEADPAMLIWLDGGENHKSHPNENFARELLELFALGVGHYSEGDVREGARGLTGWDAVRDEFINKTDAFVYDEKLADADEKTFLGQTGRWQRDDILRIVLEQPQTARYVCRRLYRELVSEEGEPDAALIEPLAAELRATNYSLEHVVGIILRSRHFFSPAVYRRRVKSPIEFCVGTIRQLEPDRSPSLFTLVQANCQQQGQVLFDPPSVKGWNGGVAWLNSATTLARMNWVVELLGGNKTAGLAPYRPTHWSSAHGITSAGRLNAYLNLLVDDDVNPATRQLATDLAGRDEEPNFAAALQVLMQSPEYSLA